MKHFWTGFWLLTAIARFPTATFAAPTVMFSEEPTPPSQTPNDNSDEPQIEFYTQDDPEAEEIKFDKPKLHDFWPKNTAYLFVRNKPIADSVADFCKMQGIDAVLSERLKDNKQRVNRSFEKMYPTHIWDQLAKAYGLLWFFDGHALYVYESGEIQTQIFKIHPLQIDPLLEVIDTMGFYGSNMRIRPMREGGILIVSGTPKMIELLTSITENISLYKTSETDRLDVKVFHLKHAWADDKEIGGLKIPGVATLLDNILGKQENTANALQPATQTASAKKITSLREKDTDEKNKKETPKEDEKTDKKAENSEDGGEKIKSDGGVITVDPRQNAVIVKDYRHKLPMYQELIDLLDVPTELIEIQAAIVNVSKGCNFRIGSDGVTVSSSHHDRTWFSYKPNSSSDTTAGKGLNVQLNGVVNGIQFMTAINTLAGKNLSKVLARPSVITMNNLTAVMEQGKTHYFEVQGNKSGDMYSVDANTNLKVTPHLLTQNGQKCIQLVLDIKDESFSPSEGKEKASTNTSSIATQALVYEGQSILVGGYFSEDYADGDSGVPVLKDVPVLGHLFKKSSRKKTISERLFLITPKIIRLSAGDPYSGLFKTPSNLTDSRELMQIQCWQSDGSTDTARLNSKYFEDPLDPSPSDATPAEGSKSDNHSKAKSHKKMSRTARLYAKKHKKAKQDDLENMHDSHEE